MRLLIIFLRGLLRPLEPALTKESAQQSQIAGRIPSSKRSFWTACIRLFPGCMRLFPDACARVLPCGLPSANSLCL